ncbi:zinc-binding dehydrogenase [Arenibacterium sp. CAU 1754]
MSLKCKATILREIGLPLPYAESRPLQVEEVTLDPPKPSEVVVKVVGAGLCHSDLSVINGARGRALPIALGHEGAGEVVEVGSGVSDVRVGDPVVFQFSASCGRCKTCQSGRPQICETAGATRATGELMAGGYRIRDLAGEHIRHHTGVSCFAEYAVVDRGSVVVIDKSIPLADAALFGCAVMTGVGAVVNTARIATGERIAIFGLGGVGLCGVMGAKAAGANMIVAIDLEDAKLAKARDLGATHTFNARDPELVEKVRDLTDGGIEFAVDLAGAIPAMESAYAMLARGGKLVTAGLSPIGAKFAFEHGDLVSDEKSICGSYMGSCVPVRDIPRFINMYQSGALPVDQLIDRYVGFDEINEGFDLLAGGTALRQVLLPHGMP